MVQITTYFVASLALLAGVVDALPRPDSSINEPAVSAPDGTPITESSMPQSTGSSTGSSSDSSMSSSSSSSSYGGSSNYGSSSGSSYGSSSGSSYGSSSGGSYGSSSGSSYGGSDSSYGSGSNYGSGNSWDSSSATTTTSAWQSYSTPSYGSGSSNWGNSGYNDCVSQCMSTYGAPPSPYTPPPSTESTSTSSGSGTTHTVIVAPMQGVLRFIPFAVNASVGDTIKFMWGANNHTVTKSSELTPCNKTSDSPFSSGEQNKGFIFTQVVNDTNPTYFYCGTPTHCEKGMFGIINPPSAAGSSSSVSNMMTAIAANSSDVSGYAAYTRAQTSGNVAASTWGSNIDLSALPEWSYPLVAENVMFTRNLIAANPDIIKTDGSVDLAAAGENPLMIPQDLAAVLASATASATSAPAATSAVSSSSADSASSTPAPVAAAQNSQNSGAFTVSSSKVVVAFVTVIVTFMMV